MQSWYCELWGEFAPNSWQFLIGTRTLQDLILIFAQSRNALRCWRISPAAANHSESLLLEAFMQEVARLRLETTKQCSFLFPICDMEISGTHGSLNIPQFSCLNGLLFWMSNSQFRPPRRGLKTLRLWDDPMNLTQWVFHDSSHQMICKLRNKQIHYLIIIH